MESFLVKLDDTHFLTGIRNGKPFGSPFPSVALQMSYDAADEVARRFRQDGYASIVTDRFGQVPTSADLVAVKRAVRYQVTFSGYYFVGVNAQGREQGTRDRDNAANMSQAAALEIVKKLQRIGFLDANIIESASPAVDVEAELEQIWPSAVAKAQ